MSEHGDVDCPEARVFRKDGATAHPRRPDDEERERRLEETREVVYGPDGRTPRAERRTRRLTILRDTDTRPLNEALRWIGRLAGAFLVGFFALGYGIEMGRSEAPLLVWLVPILCALAAAPFLVRVWSTDSDA